MEKPIVKKTAKHFDSIAGVWESKDWVNSNKFDKQITDFIAPLPSDVAVEFGIGTGALASKLAVKEMFGVDVSKGMLSKCSLPRHRLLYCDVESTPFLDGSFDLVFARNLLKHVADPQAVLKEMFRVSGKHVALIESTPLKDRNVVVPTMAVRVVEQYHPFFVSQNKLVKMAKAVGLENIEVETKVLRGKWLGYWCKAKNATPAQRREVFDIFKNAPDCFKKDQGVELFEKELEIASDFPWTFLKGEK